MAGMQYAWQHRRACESQGNVQLVVVVVVMVMVMVVVVVRKKRKEKAKQQQATTKYSAWVRREPGNVLQHTAPHMKVGIAAQIRLHTQG